MIMGMTGFGNAQVSFGKIKAIVEIKSVNHRYFDASFYLPIGFASIENKIRQILQQALERGRITVSVKIVEKPVQNIVLNKDAVRQYFKYAQQLKKEFKLDGEMTISDIIRLPGVVEAKEILVEPEELWPALEKGLKKAIQGLVKMRVSEGKSLAVDVGDKLKRMTQQIKTVEMRQQVILKQQKEVLSNDEFVAFQKSTDINEEISRMKHHIEEVRQLIKVSASAGKKMDFIAQEMQRETNTMGSKVQDKVVTNAVISLKSKIEKIREQAQNIE